MFSGAQVSLYPMSDDFVDIILGAIESLGPWRDRLRLETDSLSTLMVGPPDILFPAMRDLFCAASRSGVHTTMHATVSRGCPGEPDDFICTPVAGGRRDMPLADRVAEGRSAVATAPSMNQTIAAQLSLYPLGVDHHMDEIYGCIAFLKDSGCVRPVEKLLQRPARGCRPRVRNAGPGLHGLRRRGRPSGHGCDRFGQFAKRPLIPRVAWRPAFLNSNSNHQGGSHAQPINLDSS